MREEEYEPWSYLNWKLTLDIISTKNLQCEGTCSHVPISTTVDSISQYSTGLFPSTAGVVCWLKIWTEAQKIAC